MSEKKVGKRLLTWVLVLVMTLSLLPLNVLAANPAVMRIVRPDTDKYITYNFYLNEGDKTPYYSQIIKNNESLDVPATPEKEGSKFDGWYNGDEQFTTFGTPISVTADSTDVNLYAKFVPVCYVYFMDGTGSDARIIATEMLTPEGSLSSEDFDRAALLVPVGAEQAVIGWTKDDEQVGEVSYVEGGSIYLYPIIANGHWITFDSKGGSYVEPQFVTDTTKKPTPPAKPGYDFAGWYTNEETNNEFEFGNILSNNLTLYAKWTPNNRVSYTVIHWWENANDDGYSFHESKTEYGKVGATTSVSAERYNGFTAQTINQETIAGDGSTIVNVYYKRNVYTVKFYSYSSWVSRSEEYTNLRITAKYGANISDKWPTYDGSRTWSTNDSKNEGPYQVNLQTMPLGGANFYGPKTGRGSETAYYYVESLTGGKYELHHSDTTPGTGYSVTDEDRYPITGFTFKTYTAEQGGDWFNGYYEKYDGARFYYTRNSYNIVFINGGAEDKTLSKKYQQDISDANYTPTAPAGKVGYEFAGWYDNELCEGTAYGFTGKTMPAQNITVYAKWKAPTFTVTVYDVDKETKLKTFENVPLRGTISKDVMPSDVTLANGDTFLGWTYEDGTPFNFNTAITKNIDLYARVGNKTGYSVTYVVDSSITAQKTVDAQKYANNSKATVLNNLDPLPANEVFLGWTTEVNGTEVEYYPNSSIEITGNVILYAVYGDKAETVTVTYHSNFGTDSPYTTDAMPNNGKFTVADYKALGLPENNGYEFIGWSTNSGEQKVEFKKGESARADNIGSNDLYAQWKPIQITDVITVTIKGNTSTVTYDGTEQEVTGYTVESISNSRYTESDFIFNGTAGAKGTDAKTYQMGLKAEQIENKNSQFNNVKFEVTDGKLVINKRPITIKANDNTVTYDGNAHGKNEDDPYTVSATDTNSGLVNGHTIENVAIDFTAINAGEYKDKLNPNSVRIVAGGTNVTANYEITTASGTLNINKADSITVKVTGKNISKIYNGTEQEFSGYTTDITDKTITINPVSDDVSKVKGTNVDTYYMHLNAEDFTASSPNYKEVKVEIDEDGWLKITPITDKVTVIVTENSDTVSFDGKEHSIKGYKSIVSNNPLYDVTTSVKATETEAWTATGKTAGEYPVGIVSGDFENTNKNFSNVEFIIVDGVLKITEAEVQIHTVTFVSNGGSDVPSQKVEHEKTATKPADPTRFGYTFDAWYTDGTYTTKYDFSTPVTADITLYAKWTRNGGHHPRPKPTVEIEDDDALGLNTTDHFAYIVGYGNGEVRPQNNITRAEVATIFFRLLTDDVRDENLTKTNRYSDVTRADWYNTAVSTLSSMGIITGYPDGTFRPNAAITRAEFAAIAARFDSNGDKTTAKFSDIATHWAKDEISIAYNNGWITGYPDGTFGPQRDITRAETMTLVNRVLNRQPETEDDLLPNMTVWTDNANPNAWYYLAVQEATNSHYYKFKTNSKYEKWTELRETRDWTLLEK